MRFRDDEDAEGNPIGVPVDEYGNDIPCLFDHAVKQLREHLELLTPEQRVEVISLAFQGYCRECGKIIPEGRHECFCTRDE